MIGALYDDPVYKARMEPALLALMQMNIEPARKVALELVQEIRPDLAKQQFADAVVSHMIRANGGTPPVSLEPAKPEPKVEAQPPLPPPPVPVETKSEAEPSLPPLPPKQGELLRDQDEKSNGVHAEPPRELPPEAEVVDATAAVTAVA